MHRNWRWVLPCYLWTVPLTMVGVLIAHVFYKATSWRWRDGVLTCIGGLRPDGSTRIWGGPDAQTLGWLEMFASESLRNEDDLRVHETVHIVQAFVGALAGLAFVPVLFVAVGWSPLLGLVLGGFVGGLGFSALYGVLFLYLMVTRRQGWIDAYRQNPFEIQAYTLQDKYLANPTPYTWGA